MPERKGIGQRKEPKYCWVHRFLEGFVEIDKKLARKGKSSRFHRGQEKEEKMRVPRAPWETTEQEKAAERIAEKARKLSKEIEIKWRSLPKINIHRFETFLVDAAVRLNAKYEGFFGLERFPDDSFYFHLSYSALLENGQGADIDLLSEESICSLFAILDEKWIRMAVMIEDAIQNIKTEFLKFYCEEIEKLSAGEQELVKELQKCLEENDALKRKVSTYGYLLRKTIEFLRSTKGICKSKEIKIFREVLEETLREIDGLPPEPWWPTNPQSAPPFGRPHISAV